MKLRKKSYITLGLIAAIILLGISVWFMSQTMYVRTNKNFFAKVDTGYATLDKSLRSLPVAWTSSQTTGCYYWKKVEFSLDNGPLGCFKSRAYYFTAPDFRGALAASSQLSSLATTAFSSMQDQHFAMQTPTITGYNPETFVVYDAASGYSAIPGACEIRIDYPAPKIQAYGLPAGPKDKPLELSLSCGGDAAKAYYPMLAP